MALEGAIMSQENFEILQPVIIIGRILGILPVELVKVGTQYKLKKSLVYMIYSYALVAVLIGITVSGIQADLQMDPQHSIRIKDEKSRFVLCWDIYMVIVISLYGAVTLPLKLRYLWNLLKHLNKVDSLIPHTKNRRFRRSALVFMALTFAVSFLTMALDIAVWSSETSKLLKQATMFIKRYGAFYALYLMVMIQEVFFWHLIFIIKIRISLLNGQLRRIGREKIYKSFCVFENMRSNGQTGRTFENLRLGMLGCRIISGRLMIGFNQVTKQASFLFPVEKVTCLMNCQKEIFNAVQSINDCSGYGIHLIMLSCLVHLIATPYFLLTELLKQKVNSYYIVLQFLWIVAHIGRLLIIVEPCQQCLLEHQKTIALVCHLLNGKFNKAEKESLATFVIQLNFCRIRFSPAGLFRIERSLVTSLAGAVTTYLVILFQFNASH